MRAVPIFKPRDAFAFASSVVEFHFDDADAASRGFHACAEVVFERLNRDDRPNRYTEPSLSVGDFVLFMARATPARLLEVKPMGFEEVGDPKELRAAGLIALDSATNAMRGVVGIRPRTVGEAREDAEYAARVAAAFAERDAKK